MNSDFNGRNSLINLVHLIARGVCVLILRSLFGRHKFASASSTMCSGGLKYYSWGDVTRSLREVLSICGLIRLRLY